MATGREELEIILRAVYSGKKDVNDAIKDLDKLEKNTSKLTKAQEKLAREEQKSNKQLAKSALKDYNKDISKLGQGLKGLSSAFGLSGGTAGQLATSLGGLASMSLIAIPIIGAIAVAIVKLGQAIWETSKYAMDFAWAIKDVAMRTGSSIEEMTKLNIVAQKSGMTLEEFSKMIEVFDLKMANMQSGGKKTLEALKRLDIEVLDSQDNLKGTIQLWDEFARKAEQFGYQDRSEVATDIFGRLGSQKAIRVLDAYTQKMEYAERLQSRYSQESMKGWLEMEGVMQDIRILQEIYKMQIAEMFLPMMQQILPAIRSLMDFATQSQYFAMIMRGWQEIFEAIGALLGWIIDLWSVKFRVIDAIHDLFKNFFSDTMSMGEAWGVFMEDLGEILRGAFARPLVWLWDNLSELFLAVNGWGIDMVTKYGEYVDAIGMAVIDMTSGTATAIETIINTALTSIGDLINWAIDALNNYLSNVNQITQWIESKTGVNVGTNFGFDNIDISGAQSWVSGISDAWVNKAKQDWGNLSGKIIDQLNKENEWWGGENPFTSWLFEGGQKTGLLTDQQGDIGGNQYFRQFIDNLKDANKELEKQIQQYQVIYGNVTNTRRFFDMLGQTQTPTYSTYSTAGVDYNTTGGLSPINIQNMNVRNDGDIYRIASELDKLQKKQARIKGQAYGF